MLRVKIGTWNVCSKALKVADELLFDLKDWVSCDVDMIVLGFQELIHQLTAAYNPSLQAAYWKGSLGGNLPNYPRAGDAKISGLEPWIQLAREALTLQTARQDGIKYRLVFAGRFTAMGIIVFCRETDAFRLTRLGYGSIGTGLLGVYGNKGAIGVSLDVTGKTGDFSIAFVTAHLCAHEGESYCKHRNDEFDSILQTLVFEDIAGPTPDKNRRTVHFHDVLFLFGDLNYRFKGLKQDDRKWAVDDGLVLQMPKRSQVLQFIHDNNISGLLDFDELSYMRLIGHGSVSTFSEPTVAFMPTYKFETRRGKGEFQPYCRDKYGGKPMPHKVYSEKRLPAYCDRILFKTSPYELRSKKTVEKKPSVGASCYYSCPTYGWSDHVPLIAEFSVRPGETVNWLLVSQKEFDASAVFKARLWRLWQVNRSLVSIFITTTLVGFLIYYWQLTPNVLISQ